ncbi:MAG: nucleoid-structuring protein H-NS [Alphaproteobacteria bacterium]|nr:nucleoid-structuring protein H-NS [Alphaproteobacteria bacterium]
MGLDYRVRCCPDGLMTDRRHNVKVLDCTIRDGGCNNDWLFSHELVGRTFDALVKAGVDVMEVGYWTSPGVYDPATTGPWRFCREDDLVRVVRASDMKLAVMCDMGRIRKEDIPPKGETAIDIVRVATYAKDVPEAVDLLQHCRELGYETFCNVMAVTTCTPQEVDAFLGVLRESAVQHIAVVDSFGAMYPHHVRYLIRKYKNWLRPDQGVGVHLHNNQETAFANTIAGIDEGADFVDATIFGMGRGAGNCPLELLLMYLDDPRHDVRPILELTDELADLRAELKWGYHVPYAVTGWLNLHPRSAIDRMRLDRSAPREFYDTLTANRPRARHHEPRKG